MNTEVTQNKIEIKAVLNHLRIAPRKVRMVAEVIKGLPVDLAKAKLLTISRKPKDSILKLLNSAIANAKHNYKVEPKKLFIKSIVVNNGPILKRWMPRARGSASPIFKRTSHIILTLGVAEKEIATSFPIIETKTKKTKTKKDSEMPIKKHEHEKDEKTPHSHKDKDIKPKEETEKNKRVFRRKAI